MKIEWDGGVLDLDLQAVTLQQAVVITGHTGLSLSKWETALLEPDGDAWLPSMACLYWLTLAQNDQACQLSGLDFPVLKFYTAFADAVGAEAAALETAPEDPTRPAGEPAAAEPNQGTAAGG